MKWKLASCIILLASMILQAIPVIAASGTTIITGAVPLVTYDVTASNIGYHRATISWKTNGDATSQIFYDTASHDNITGYAHHTEEDANLVSEHSLNLTGLSSSITYHYRVRSAIPGTEFIAVSSDYTFTTLSSGGGGGGSWVPPLPPPLPPGATDVSHIVTTDGIFTKGVIAESLDNVCRLTIAKGTKGLTKENDPLSQITMSEMEVPPPPPPDSSVIGLAYDLGPDGAAFEPPITLTITYDPSLIPEGVGEENLGIAYYDKDTSQWIELDSVVDTEAHIISAKVNHFTAFAVFGYEVVVPPAVPPVLPAAFTVSHLSISPSEVYIGERVSIRIIVANTGDESGSYKVTLKINGVVEAAKEVTVNAGLSREVTFTILKDTAGTYSVGVDGLTGSFRVKERVVPPAVPTVPPVITKAIDWPLVGGITAGVIVVGFGIFFLIRRRALRNRIKSKSPEGYETIPKSQERRRRDDT